MCVQGEGEKNRKDEQKERKTEHIKSFFFFSMRTNVFVIKRGRREGGQTRWRWNGGGVDDRDQGK